MKITRITKALVLLTIATGALAVGCELIVDFDRTKILVEVTPDSSIPDASPTGDGSTVVPTEAGSTDGGDAGDASAPTADASDASDASPE